MYHLLHAGQPGIFSGCFDDLTVDIIPLNISCHRKIHLFPCLFQGITPALLWDQFSPLLCQKCPVHAGGYACCHHRCFYNEGPAAAKRVHQNTFPLPGRQHQKSSRQRLCDRCLGRQLSVSSLMQRNPRRVQANYRLIFQKRYPDRIAGPVLRKPFHTIVFL